MRDRWCAEHGDQLNRVAREFHKRKTQKAKPPAKQPDPFGRLPRIVRLKRLTDHVAAADGPVSRKEAAQAAGLKSTQGSLPRLIKAGIELGLIETRAGSQGGLLPGPKATAQIAPDP